MTAGRTRLAPLFAPATPRSPNAATLALVATLAATAYSLGRIGGPGAFNTVWAEDAQEFLTDAFTRRAVDTIFEPLNGYFVVLPRLLAEFASLFPVPWSVGVLTTSAALFSAAAGLLVYVASGSVLDHPLARVVAASSVVAEPMAESLYGGAPNQVATLHFVALSVLFWCAMWTPASRAGRVVVLTVVLLSTLSSILVVAYLPLLALRVWVLRDRSSVAVLGMFGLGEAVQIGGLLSGVASRGTISHPQLNPLWALHAFATWALPYGMFGQTGVRQPEMVNFLVQSGNGAGPLYYVAVVAAWVVVVAVVGVALLRWTRPRWLFAGIAAAHAVAILCLTIMIQGELVLRYVYAPWLLVVTALVALLVPRQGLPRWRALAPLAVFAVILAACALANYRVPSLRTGSQPWDEKVRQARAGCAGRAGGTARLVMDASYPWTVTIPCHRLH